MFQNNSAGAASAHVYPAWTHSTSLTPQLKLAHAQPNELEFDLEFGITSWTVAETEMTQKWKSVLRVETQQ
jgi:hypothetical protein